MYSYKRFMVILVVFVYTGCDDLVSSEAKQDFRHLAGVFATKTILFIKFLVIYRSTDVMPYHLLTINYDSAYFKSFGSGPKIIFSKRLNNARLKTGGLVESQWLNFQLSHRSLLVSHFISYMLLQ